MLKVLLVVLSAFACIAYSASLTSDVSLFYSSGPYRRHLFEEGGDARCLDGSPSGVYYVPNPKSSQFIIFFQGGGWCISPQDCLERSHTEFGSSKNWGEYGNSYGIMSTDCSINPDFCDWNLIFVPYCDGNSFTGSRADTMTVGEANLFFRGAETVERVLDWAADTLGLTAATDVVLSGCSAGGLASILNANRVSFFLRKHAHQLERMRVVPMSGVFLDAPTVGGVHQYGEWIRSIVNMSEPRYKHKDDTEQDACLRDNRGDPAACHFAEHSLPYVKEPIFVVNSVVDSWSLPCILAGKNSDCSAYPDWVACTDDISNCTAAQMPTINAFASRQADAVPEDKTPRGGTGDVTTLAMRFAGLLPPSNTAAGAKIGAFFHSCFSHCEGALNWGWSKITVDGVKIRRAVADFVFADDSEPAQRFMPCEWESEAPWQCNPTCNW